MKTAYIRKAQETDRNSIALCIAEEFERLLEYPVTTGYIEFVAVRKKYRKQGVTTTMLQENMRPLLLA